MNQTLQAERLYYTYFQNFPNIVEPAQRDQPVTSEAFSAYMKGDWENALAEFEILMDENPQDAYPLFYHALAAMQLERWPRAIQSLEKVRSGNDDRFVEPATWYVALAYLRNEDDERAKLILETIADGPGKYQRDAQAILAELE